MHGTSFGKLDFAPVDAKADAVAAMISDRSGQGADFLGWLDYASKFSEADLNDIVQTAGHIRKKYEALVLVGIGGSYLGARAVIEAINGFYPNDPFEIVYVGNTLSSSYIKQVMDHLKGKRFAINVISKSGTTIEPSISFRLLKEMLQQEFGKAYLKDAIYATTDAQKGALKEEATKAGYKTFVIPDAIGGRFSVITPVGLLPIACAGIDIRKFLVGVRDGEKQYAEKDYRKNPAYLYGAVRYLLNIQKHYTAEMFISYEPNEKMIAEWLKQLFDESEGKDNKGLFCGSGIFTTDLHSMGQFIQQGTPGLFETIIVKDTPIADIVVPEDEENLDGLNYIAGKKVSYINQKACLATLDAHSNGHTPCNVIEIPEMDAYNLGNLIYFFFKATAFSAYLLGVNPFNQPGVEIYKANMFKLLGRPAKEK
jgi:glucose-6-phosphate isomerase